MQTSGGRALKADRRAGAKSPREEYAWQIQEIAKRLELTWRKNEVGKVGSEVRRGKGIAGKKLLKPPREWRG